MAFRKYLKYRPRRYRKKPTKLVKKALVKVRNSNFKKKVLSVIHQQNETKQAFNGIAYVNFNSAISGLADVGRIIPNIGVGANDYQRIGDQIRAQKLTFDCIVQFPPITGTTLHNNPGACRIGVRIMIVTPKSYPNWASASTAPSDWTQWLLKTGGTTHGFDGNVSDLYAKVNTDAITCHYNKVMYMNQPYVLHNGSTTDVAMSTAGLTRHIRKVFNFRNALFKYDANIDGGLTPANRGMFFVLGYCYTDGSTSPDIITTRVRAQYSAILDYEDA